MATTWTVAKVVFATPKPGHQSVVIRRLTAYAELEPASIDILNTLSGSQSFRPGQWVFDAGAAGQKPRFITSGWAARVRHLPDGRRQIQSFVLPGDIVGPYGRAHPIACAPVAALTTVTALDASPLAAAVAQGAAPGLSTALYVADCLAERQILDQVVRLGRLTAYERLCHLFLEFRERLSHAGLTQGMSFPMPLTQEQIADATGLSTVHVNRTLQQLRREKLLRLAGGLATILDAESMKRISDFHPADPCAWR